LPIADRGWRCDPFALAPLGKRVIRRGNFIRSAPTRESGKNLRPPLEPWRLANPVPRRKCRCAIRAELTYNGRRLGNPAERLLVAARGGYPGVILIRNPHGTCRREPGPSVFGPLGEGARPDIIKEAF